MSCWRIRLSVTVAGAQPEGGEGGGWELSSQSSPEGGKPLGVLRKGVPSPGLHVEPPALGAVSDGQDGGGAGSQESIRDPVAASWGWGRWWQLRLDPGAG